MTPKNILFLSDGLKKEQNEAFIKFTGKVAEKLRRQGAVIGGYGSADSDILDFHAGELREFSQIRNLMKRPEKYVIYAPWSLDRYSLPLIFWLKLAGKKCRLLLIHFPQLSKNQKKRMQTVLNLLKPDLFIASEDIEQDFHRWYKGRIHRFRAAVDTEKYHPVTPEQKRLLRKKYNLPQEVPLLFHAGHIIIERRLEWMLEIPEGYLGILASSSFNTPDQPTRQKLMNHPNVWVLSGYYPEIQELFQACDIYVFTPTVLGAMNIPLSVFEAMACNLPVVSTRHGELRAIESGDGLHYIDGSDPGKTVEKALEVLHSQAPCHTREKVLCYDWNHAVQELTEWNHGTK